MNIEEESRKQGRTAVRHVGASLLLAVMMVAWLTLCSGCAHSDPWTPRDTWMQVGVTAVYAADAYTTSKIQHNPPLIEVGLARHALGRYPGTSETYMYFGTLMLSNYLISRALPARLRPYWQGANMAAHGKAVIVNCQAGLCP